MRNSVILLSLSIAITLLSACNTKTSDVTANEIATKEVKESNNTAIATQTESQPSQPQNNNETYVQTEAEVIATDGLMFANSYGVPADIGIKRFMFEHHSDFFEQQDALVATYKQRLISHGFSKDITNGGHYLIFLTAGDKPKETVIIRKGKLTEKPTQNDIDPKILEIAIELLQTDTALPVKFVVLNVSQKEYQTAQQRVQDPVIFAKLKQKIPNLNSIHLNHDNEKIYARLDVEKQKGLGQGLGNLEIADIAKQILKLDIKIQEIEHTSFVY